MHLLLDNFSFYSAWAQAGLQISPSLLRAVLQSANSWIHARILLKLLDFGLIILAPFLLYEKNGVKQIFLQDEEE